VTEKLEVYANLVGAAGDGFACVRASRSVGKSKMIDASEGLTVDDRGVARLVIAHASENGLGVLEGEREGQHDIFD
jgi:hypothetical protein